MSCVVSKTFTLGVLVLNISNLLHSQSSVRYQEQIRYCFSVYDLTGKGIIAKEEMTTLLQKCLKLQGQEEEGEDGVKVEEDDISDTMISLHCVDND